MSSGESAGVNAVSRSGPKEADPPSSVGSAGKTGPGRSRELSASAVSASAAVGAIVWPGRGGALNSRVQKRQDPSSAVGANGKVSGAVPVKAGPTVSVGMEVGTEVKVEVGAEVKVIVRVGVEVGIGVKVNVRVGVEVGTGVKVIVRVGVKVGIGVKVNVRVEVEVSVAVGVNVNVAVGVSVEVETSVAVAVGANVGVIDAVGVSDSFRISASSASRVTV